MGICKVCKKRCCSMIKGEYVCPKCVPEWKGTKKVDISTIKLKVVDYANVKTEYWLDSHITYDGIIILYIYKDRVGNELTRTPEEYKKSPVKTIYAFNKDLSCLE